MASSVETSANPVEITQPAQLGPAQLDGLFSPRHLGVTIGIISSVLLTAFEAMAVSTAMPIAVADLHGLPYYSLAFSAFLTLSLLGMVLAGQRADARGPRLPYLGGFGLFGAGLLAAGTATSMAQFVLGRALQGFGSGLMIVSLYILVARAYPEYLRSKAFSVIASCWVLPAIIGPLIAGVLTEDVSWRWVFLGVAVLIVVPLAFLLQPLRNVPDPPETAQPATETERARQRTVRICAALTALGAGLFQFGSQQLNRVGAVLVPLALVLLVSSVPKLLPRGIFRAGRGLPTVVAMRGLMAATYFGIEAFIPLMLVQERAMSVTGAGFSLTGAAVSWALAAWSINRPWLRNRLSQAGMVRLGAGVTAASMLLAIAAISPHVPQWTAAVAMFLGAIGMGLVWPNVSVLTLELSDPGDQGANAASLQVADGLGSTLSIAVAGAVYHALHTSAAADRPVFALMYSMFIAVGAVAWLIAPRVRVR
ncbi:MAG TPA: MFS transporter [Actinocrinis sp.]|nr:MFS transporter [Actinocrinis sp.]